MLTYDVTYKAMLNLFLIIMFLLSTKIFSSEIDYTTLRYGFLVFNLAKKGIILYLISTGLQTNGIKKSKITN